MALLTWYLTHPNTNANVLTGPRTKSEHCKHRSATYQAGELTTTNQTDIIGNNDEENASVQLLRALHLPSDNAAVPIHGWRGSVRMHQNDTAEPRA